MTLVSDLLNGVLSIDRSADAIEFDRHWYSWGELGDIASAVRDALDELGLGAEARVGIMLQTRPGPLAAMLATVSVEACLVSVNPLLPDDRLVGDLAALRLPVVIAESSDLVREGVAAALAAAGTAVIELQGVLDGVILKPKPAPVDPPPRATEPGIIIEMLSSGTTGPPKRIPLKRVAFEKSFVAALSYEKGRNAAEAPRLRSGVTILAAPMTHIGGLWGALTCVLGGRRSCLLQKFSVDLWLDAVARHRPKVAGAVPAALRMILDANVPREDLSSLIALRTGAAPLDPATTQEFWERYGIPVLQNYGATEFSGAIAGWTLGDFHAHRDAKATSVGRFQPGVVGQIVDPERGTVLPAGAEGILEVCSEQFGDGATWQRTTDRAAIDAEGFLYILGRADNAIIRGGFKVHPDDVVVAIEQHPAVREAVVVGIADKRLGAVPAAVLMLKNGAARPSNEELGSFLRDRLLPYQVPTQFLIVDDVPRTGSFKPALPQVRELFDAAGAA